MNKLWLIIKREYLTRVRKRSFILATLLTPLAFAVLFAVVGLIFSYEDDVALKIAVFDEIGVMNNEAGPSEKLRYIYPNTSFEEIRDNFDTAGYDGILVIPKLKDLSYNKHTVYYYANDQMSLEVKTNIESKLSAIIRDYKIDSFGLNKKELESLKTRVSIDPQPINSDSADTSSMAGVIAAAIGGAMGVIMYMTVFIYGMMVMRSVMEEKVSRIVEVMISSVKPFQLMMGKIIGVGAVGLTQVAIWAILVPIFALIFNFILGVDPASMNNMPAGMGDPNMGGLEEMDMNMGIIMEELAAQKWWLIIPLFIVYFLGGYFLYASLFAAVGSAMSDDTGEGQALTIPITIPVLIAFYIMMVAVRAPNSSLAVWASIFPLFSPIVMPARLAFDPPFWQIALSIVVLIATAIFFVWLSARIYRVGILMYGKKVSFREIGKWMFMRA